MQDLAFAIPGVDEAMGFASFLPPFTRSYSRPYGPSRFISVANLTLTSLPIHLASSTYPTTVPFYPYIHFRSTPPTPPPSDIYHAPKLPLKTRQINAVLRYRL